MFETFILELNVIGRTEYVSDFDKRGLDCAFIAHASFFISTFEAGMWAGIASRRTEWERMRHETRAPGRLDFLRKSGELRIFLWGGGVDIGSQEGRRHRRLSFILSDSLSKSEFLPSGYTLELKEQPSRLSSLFSFLFQASPLPRPFNPVLGKAWERIEKARKTNEKNGVNEE